MMTIRKRSDSRAQKVILHRVADIPNGVGIRTSELGGDYIYEGTPLLAADDSGLYSVAKYATVAAAVTASAKTVNVSKGHQFKVGDIVTPDGANGVATKITAIATDNSSYDVLTLSAALGALDKDSCIVEAAAEASSASAVKGLPVAIVGTGYPIRTSDNIFTDAWVIAVTHGNALPSSYAAALKGVVNI